MSLIVSCDICGKTSPVSRVERDSVNESIFTFYGPGVEVRGEVNNHWAKLECSECKKARKLLDRELEELRAKYGVMMTEAQDAARAKWAENRAALELRKAEGES